MKNIIDEVSVHTFLLYMCTLFLLGQNFIAVATELVRKLPLQIKVDTKTKKQFVQDFSNIKRAINEAIQALKNIVIQTPIKEIQKIASPSEGQKIKAMALSGNGKMIVAAGSLGEDDNLKAYLALRLINVDASIGEGFTSTFMEKNTSIISAAISPDNKKIAFVCDTNENVSTFEDVFLTNVADSNIANFVPIHTVVSEKEPKNSGIVYAGNSLKTMRAVAFHPNGTIMVAGGLENKLYVWKSEPNHTIYSEPQILEGKYGKINTIVFSADGRRMATATDDGNCLLLWTITNDGIIDPTPKHIKPFYSFTRGYKIALAPHGGTLAIGVKDTVEVWDIQDINNITQQGRVTFPEWQRCDSLAFSHNSKQMIIQGSTESHGKLILCDVSDLKKFHQTVSAFPYYHESCDGWGCTRFHFNNRSNIGLFSHDNTKIIAAIDGSLKVFDISDRELKKYDTLSEVLTLEQAQLIVRLNDAIINRKDIIFSDIDKKVYQDLPAQVHSVLSKNNSAAFTIANVLKKNSVLPERVKLPAKQQENSKQSEYSWTSLFSAIKIFYNRLPFFRQSSSTTNSQ